MSVDAPTETCLRVGFIGFEYIAGLLPAKPREAGHLVSRLELIGEGNSCVPAAG